MQPNASSDLDRSIFPILIQLHALIFVRHRSVFSARSREVEAVFALLLQQSNVRNTTKPKSKFSSTDGYTLSRFSIQILQISPKKVIHSVTKSSACHSKQAILRVCWIKSLYQPSNIFSKLHQLRIDK